MVKQIPEDTLKWFKGDELRARVFYEKYSLQDLDGNHLEKTPPEMWERVSAEISSVEKDKEKWRKNFYWLLENFRFVPGGRIMFGAGNPRKATLLNCYYNPIKEDSIEGIFDCAKEMARTYSYGGGVGIDITILRPKGSPVNNSAIYSTGAVSFMDLFSKVTGTIGQSGRRGALMITIEDRHPDVFDFISVKDDPLRLNVRYANISVKISDELMEAVKSDGSFTLWFESDKVKRIEHKVKARDLWNQLIKRAWSSAEPGIIFWSTAKKFSPTEYDEKMAIKGCNPCSEQMLEDYGCCNLGNLNLSKFVNLPFHKKPDVFKFWDIFSKKGMDKAMEYAKEHDWAHPNLKELEKAVRLGMRFLDDVLDYSADKHPLKAQREASLYTRRTGLGATGLGDMLAMMRLKYDTDESVYMMDKLFEFIKNIAYDESSEIAHEKGVFPAFNREKHLDRPFLQGVSEEVREKIWNFGLRNACLLTIPPVGSGAILAGTTGGIEPIFALSYIRRSESLSQEYFKVYHPLVAVYLESFGGKDENDLPDFFVTAHQIDPKMRVKIQGTIQKHIDSSISSTVNLPNNTTVEEIGKIYELAWEYGCKGITVYREGSREGVLITEDFSSSQKVPEIPDECPACGSVLRKTNSHAVCRSCGIYI
ncbi:MAG: adenosylcobalamin-dependent ribonucleoside-diphosphate reductase [bacterium]|nr:adenosylcobalamin-dependent ribonucleoside-diphosphate reductase [bacterium]